MSTDRQEAKVDGSGNIIVQAVESTVTIQGLPHLTLIPPRNRIPKTQTEIDLLNPYRRAFALVGRERDMAELWSWLQSPRPVSVRTITGRAGAGKTRAAIELIERLGTERPGQWWAGFVQGRELRRFAEQQNLADWGWARPTLIVVDYAASLIEPLRDWLRDLAQNAARADGRPLRLLLLERDADSGASWLQSLFQGGQSEARLPELFDPLEPRRLDRLDTPAKRREVLARMLAAAAPLAGCKAPVLPAAGKSPRFDKQLENPAWEDPLYLMMAALLSLRSDLVEVLDLPRTELALRLVDHEIKRLEEDVASPVEKRLLVHLAAFASLGNGLSHEQALAVAEEESAALMLVCPEGPGALVSRLHEVLPAPDHGLAPVLPDILAEALVLRAMDRCSAAQQEAAARRAVQKLGRRVVPFILRTVQDFAPAGQAAPLKWLEHLIKAGIADDPGLLAEIENAMPHQTLVLREKAVEVDELLAQRLGKLARENPSEEILSEQSRLLNNLSVRLSDLGRREEALAKAQEAVRIREQLAQARPDAFLPDLAMSLNNLATMLSDLGRREEALAKAQEAVRIYEQLAQARPDAFLPDLAMSCGALGMVYVGMERHGEASASFGKGIRALLPLFQQMPQAFAELMAKLFRVYLQATEQAQQPPDKALLAPVLEVFEKLKQNKPKE